VSTLEREEFPCDAELLIDVVVSLDIFGAATILAEVIVGNEVHAAEQPVEFLFDVLF
jgi:hypothetical protein